MPIILKQFSGMMDLDAPNENIGHSNHRESWNMRFNGPKGNERPEVVAGNRLIAGQSFLPPGINKQIGRHYDSVYKRIFYMNCNSNGNHAIYILNTLTKTFQTLLAVGPLTSTDTSVLGFTFNGPIDDIDIIYGDPQEGDLLVFLDSLGRPTKLNIQRYLANTYGTVLRSYINVIKAPHLYPPLAVYENDPAVQVNNCLNSLFIFAYTKVFDDNEESVLSPACQMPLPIHSFTNIENWNKSNDARIALFLRTGDVNVIKFNIYMKQTQNGATSDWMFVDTIDKAASGIASNTTYKYLFYNSGNYTPVDQAFATDLFDYVPDYAGAQALINGDTLLYADIIEGYDWFKSVFNISVNTQSGRHAINGFLFFAATDGTFTGTQPNIKLTIAGAGPNAATVQFPASNMWVYAVSDSAGDISFNVSTPVPSGSIATLLGTLQSAATGVGWTVIAPTDSNSIRIYYPTGNISLKGSYYNDGGIGPIHNLLIPIPCLCHYEGSSYSYGIRYKDENGKSIGVITDVTANINTVAANNIIGQTAPFSSVALNLSGIIPPSWAASYDVMRTDTLTYSKYFNWVSKRTLNGVDPANQIKYGYIDITNIDDFNEAQKASIPVVTYGFEIGDRIRFVANYVPGASTSYLTNDYAVLGITIDPVINGQSQTGRFITILYPASDINANFNLTDDYHFANYQITVYHIASSSAPQTANQTVNAGTEQPLGNVYYSTGFTFGIGNKGLLTAYHYGNVANNQVQIQDGDVFYRQRTVPVGSTYYYLEPAVAFAGQYFTAPIGPNPTPVNVPGFYATSSQTGAAADPFNGANFPRYSDAGGIFQNNSTGPINLRLRGTFNVSSIFITWVDLLVKLVHPTNPTIPVTASGHSEGVGNAVSIETITVTYDSTFVVPPGYKVWLILGNGEVNPGTTNTHFGSYIMRLDIINNITIQVYDKSFSDTYNLITNSDDQPDTAQPEQRRLEYTTKYRWGQQDQLDSNQNNSNRFYGVDFDEALKNYGKIVKCIPIGKLLHIFHERKFGTVGIFQQWIKNNTGSDQLIVSDTIITKNNIRYEIYDGGVGNQKGSLTISNYDIYGVDPVKGFIFRLAPDGVTLISLLYRSQTWAGENLPNYLNSYTYQFGGDARILGTFKIVKDNNSIYLLMAQGGTNASGQSIDGRVVVFDETDNAFEGFYNINADQIVNAENDLYTSYGGAWYMHDDTSIPANFFGVQYPSSITLIFNEKEAQKKNFERLSYQANQFFISPVIGDINTNFINPQTGLRQQSQLIIQDGEINDTEYHFAFKFDANSDLDPRVGLNEGDYLIGNWIEIKLTYSGGQTGYIFAPYINYEDDPKNF